MEETVDITTDYLPSNARHAAVTRVVTAVNLAATTANLVCKVRDHKARAAGKDLTPRDRRWCQAIALAGLTSIVVRVATEVRYTLEASEHLKAHLRRAGLPVEKVMDSAPKLQLAGWYARKDSAGWIARNCACTKTGTMVDVHVIITPVGNGGHRAVEVITTPAK